MSTPFVRVRLDQFYPWELSSLSLDELADQERCKGCGVTREQNDICETPCPFDECPFKEMK